MDLVEQALKIAALAGGGLFFAWKLATGWLIINLKVSVKLERATKSLTHDHLGITVTLEKGATDSVWLQHVSARVLWSENGDPKPIDMSEEFRWLGIRDQKVTWGQLEASAGPIALAPGEQTSIGGIVEVPADKPVTVEIAAFGKRAFWPRGFQWRASSVSLPLPKPNGAK